MHTLNSNLEYYWLLHCSNKDVTRVNGFLKCTTEIEVLHCFKRTIVSEPGKEKSPDAMASASTPTPNNSKNSSNFSDKSHFRKTVCLKDWWLEKPANNSEVEDSPLVIAGITSREKQAVRVFSAPILKRCDVFYLETVDGVFVIIQGFINKARTEANGFSSEICKHFLFGFPLDWEICAQRFYMGESPLSSVSKRSQVENHGQVHSELTNSFSEVIMSKDEDILPKCGSLDGDDEIGNGEAVSAYKSGGRSVVKQTVNNSDTTGKIPQSRDTRGRFTSTKQKKTSLGRRKQSISRSSTPRAEKLRKKLAYYPVSAYKSGGRSVVKQTVNNSDTTGKSPQSRDTRGRFNSTKQKKTSLGRRKQSISRSSTPRAEKPRKKLAYGSSASHEQKDASAVSPLSSNHKRSRSGRLLLPRQEFWRDQRAVYNVDRQITGVEDLNLNALSGDPPDPSSGLRQMSNLHHNIKKPFGVVSVIPGTDKVHEENGHEVSSVNYDGKAAIEFLEEKMKNDSIFSFNETVQVCVSGVEEHLSVINT